MLFIKELDMKVGPIPRGKLVTIGGGVGCGKTTYGLNVFYENVFRQGYSGCFFSLEMGREEIEKRLLVRHSHNKKFKHFFMDITFGKLKNHRLSEQEEALLRDIVEPDLHSTDHGLWWVVDQRMLEHSDFESITNVLYSIEGLHPGMLDFIVVWREGSRKTI